MVLRGLAGSGKSRTARTFRDIEVANGGEAPRVLSIDDYFLQETEVKKKDEETGKMVKVTEMQYVYEAEMEPIYQASFLKAFKRTIDEGLYKFIIVDAPNITTDEYKDFWSHAKTKGYEVYIFEVLAHVDTCAERNVHGRSRDEVLGAATKWVAVPEYMIKMTNLDAVLRADTRKFRVLLCVKKNCVFQFLFFFRFGVHDDVVCVTGACVCLSTCMCGCVYVCLLVWC